MNRVLLPVLIIMSVLLFFGAGAMQVLGTSVVPAPSPEVIPASGDAGLYVFLATLAAGGLALILLYRIAERTLPGR